MVLRRFRYRKSWHDCPALMMGSYPGKPPFPAWTYLQFAFFADLASHPVDVQSAAQRAFGRRHFVLGPLVNRDRRPQGPRKPFEARLRYMMIVDSVKGLDVKRDSGVHGEGLKPFIDQLGIKGSNLVAAECRPKHQEGSPRYVDGDTGH